MNSSNNKKQPICFSEKECLTAILLLWALSLILSGILGYLLLSPLPLNAHCLCF